MYTVAACLKKSKKFYKKWLLGEKTVKNSDKARQCFMAPVPSRSSSRDVAGNRTFTHHESPVSSLHRTAEASIAVEGLRNTYIIYVLDRRVLPPSLSGSKHRWWEGLRNTSFPFPHRSPYPIAHSGSKRRQWRACRSLRC